MSSQTDVTFHDTQEVTHRGRSVGGLERIYLDPIQSEVPRQVLPLQRLLGWQVRSHKDHPDQPYDKQMVSEGFIKFLLLLRDRVPEYGPRLLDHESIR